MKKRITAVISLILAFVMCFALVACNGEGAGSTDGPNGPNGPDNPNKPTVVTSVRGDKVATAFEQLTEAHGFKGEAKVKVLSDSHNYDYTLDFDKRGDRVKCTVGETSFILDLTTGNKYTALADGKYDYEQVLPIGALDYAEYILGELPEFDGELDLSEIKLSYDAATKTASYKKDLASELNNYLEPIADAYEYNKSIKDLLNSYLAMYSEVLTVDGIIGMVAVSKNMTVDEVISMLELLGLDDAVAALRAAIDENLDEDAATALYDRKVGEIVAGLYDFIVEMIGSEAPDQPLPGEQVTTVDETAPSEGEEGGTSEIIGGGIIGMQPVVEEMMAELLDFVINREYTEKQVNDALDAIDKLLGAVLGIGVKNVVDEYVPDMSGELYAAIQNGVTFNKLGAELNIGLEINDDVYTITGFDFTAQCKHSYKGEAGKDWMVLSDNNYNATVSVKIGEYYTAATGDFDITVSPDAEQSEIMAVVYGTLGSDYTVKLELGGKTVTGATAIAAYVVGGDGPIEIELPETGAVVSFDAATGSLIIDKQFINDAFTSSAYDEANEGASSAGVETLALAVTLATADGDIEIAIAFIKMPDTVDGLIEMIQNIMPDMPDDNEQTEGAAEI